MNICIYSANSVIRFKYYPIRMDSTMMDATTVDLQDVMKEECTATDAISSRFASYGRSMKRASQHPISGRTSSSDLLDHTLFLKDIEFP